MTNQLKHLCSMCCCEETAGTVTLKKLLWWQDWRARERGSQRWVPERCWRDLLTWLHPSPPLYRQLGLSDDRHTLRAGVSVTLNRGESPPQTNTGPLCVWNNKRRRKRQRRCLQRFPVILISSVSWGSRAGNRHLRGPRRLKIWKSSAKSGNRIANNC